LPFLPIWLTACASLTDTAPVNLGEVPAGLATCTDSAIPPLPGAAGTGWDTPAAVGIIGDQRRAALAKDACARNWRDFYNDLRARLAARVNEKAAP
jgi:hypothetical protein